MKKQILEYTNKAVFNVEDGVSDPLESIADLKEILDAVDQAISIIKPYAVDELEKYGKEGKKVGAFHLTTRNTGDRLDYAADMVYSNLNKLLKERSKVLKIASSSTGDYYDEDGDKIEGVPVKTHGQIVPNFKRL